MVNHGKVDSNKRLDCELIAEPFADHFKIFPDNVRSWTISQHKPPSGTILTNLNNRSF